MRRRVIRFVAIAVVTPVAGRLAMKAADNLEASGARSGLSRGLRWGGSMLGQPGRRRF